MPLADGTHYYNSYLVFSKLEQTVDLTVWYLANAMTWVINGVDSYKCSLGVEDLQQAVSKQISLGIAFMMASYLGISLVDLFMRSSDSAWLLSFLYA